MLKSPSEIKVVVRDSLGLTLAGKILYYGPKGIMSESTVCNSSEVSAQEAKASSYCVNSRTIQPTSEIIGMTLRDEIE